MERLGIMWVPYTVSSCSSAHSKRTSGSQEIWRSLLISWKITGLAQNPLNALVRPKQAAQKSEKISLRVAMALRDSCNTRWLACKITGGNSQPIVRSWLVEQPIRLHFHAVSSALPPFSLQPPFFGGWQYEDPFQSHFHSTTMAQPATWGVVNLVGILLNGFAQWSGTNNVPHPQNMGPRVPRGPTWRSMWKDAAWVITDNVIETDLSTKAPETI